MKLASKLFAINRTSFIKYLKNKKLPADFGWPTILSEAEEEVIVKKELVEINHFGKGCLGNIKSLDLKSTGKIS